MKTIITASIAMLVGGVIGGVAMQGLHAQGSKPLIYAISEIDVTNPEKYASEFAGKAQTTIRNAGGKLFLIGGVGATGAKPITAIEGTPPKRYAIQTWESQDAFDKWYKSAEYQELLKIGKQYASWRRYTVEGQ